MYMYIKSAGIDMKKIYERHVGMVMGITIGGAVFSSLTGTALQNTAFMYAIRVAYMTGMVGYTRQA